MYRTYCSALCSSRSLTEYEHYRAELTKLYRLKRTFLSFYTDPQTRPLSPELPRNSSILYTAPCTFVTSSGGVNWRPGSKCNPPGDGGILSTASPYAIVRSDNSTSLMCPRAVAALLAAEDSMKSPPATPRVVEELMEVAP